MHPANAAIYLCESEMVTKNNQILLCELCICSSSNPNGHSSSWAGPALVMAEQGGHRAEEGHQTDFDISWILILSF